MDNTTKAINARLDNLLRSMRDSEADAEDFEMVEAQLQKIPEYFNAVVSEDVGVRIARVRHEDDIDALHSAIESLDRARRLAHENLAGAFNILSRISAIYEVEPVFQLPENRELDINSLEDREIAVDMCYNYCKDTFLQVKDRDRFKDASDTRETRDNELHSIAEDGGYFKNVKFRGDGDER